MRSFIFLISILTISACKTKVDSINPAENNVKEEIKGLESECPEAGVCTVELFRNKNLIIKEDGTGALYPEIVDGANVVVQYTYSVKGPEGTVDGDYSETIHFEVPPSVEALNLKDADLKNLKLVFGKHCYCKGEAGYYFVEKGNLTVNKSTDALSFSLTFEMDHPEHQINTIVSSSSL